MKTTLFTSMQKLYVSFAILFTGSISIAQTTVYDIIASSTDHTYLKAAIDQENLATTLDNNAATFTVFAPDNAAFDDLAAALQTDIPGLLALPNLADILLYHVLDISVSSSMVNNGDIVNPLHTANSLKLTKTNANSVYVNQGMVNAPDLMGSNGYVHSIDAVVLPWETVIDVAIDNGFTSLYAAVAEAELLPTLTDPLADYTVFAPTNTAFDDLAAALQTDIPGLLALPNLADILTYHVLGTNVNSSAINNGDIAQPLSPTNSLKLTVTDMGAVYVNQAQVSLPNVSADNGIVHVLDAVVLPFETVIDIAIDNGFTSLYAAVSEAELLPALTDPLAEYTVFAPTNAAFDNLATALQTDLNGLLASPDLANILLYHVIDGAVLSTSLTNGPVTMLNTQNAIVDLTSGVMINDANVTLADLISDNGVVHVIDAVLVPSLAGIDENLLNAVQVFPNPSNGIFTVDSEDLTFVSVLDLSGKELMGVNVDNGMVSVDLSGFENGTYILNLSTDQGSISKKITKLSGK